MTREHEKILDDLLPKIDKMMYSYMMDNRKESIGKREFKRRYAKYSKKMSSFSQEKLPFIMLIQRVNLANDLVGFTKSLAHRRNRFAVNPLPLDGRIAKSVLSEFEKPLKEVLVPMLDGDASLLSSAETSTELPYSKVREVLLPHAFLSVWTALESYLQDRIRMRVFSSREEFVSFIEKVELRRLPDTWKESGKPVTASELGQRIPELMDQHLQVYFGNLRKNGHADTLYRQCFNIRISKYPKMHKLQKISQLRNAVVHEGTTWFGLSIIQFEYTWLRKFELLVLDFAEWIEEEIEKADLAKSGLRKKSRKS